MLETMQLTCFVFSCSPNKTATDMVARCTQVTHRDVRAQPPPASTNSSSVAHGDSDSFLLSDQHDQSLAAGDAGVEQITL